MDYLKSNGYMVIDNVLSPEEVDFATKLFHEWRIKNQIVSENNGLIHSHNAGHQEHAWYIRTSTNVTNIFKQLWNTNDLIVSFDGCCYMGPEDHYDGKWTHVDQSPNNTEFRGYQGFVSLTDNQEKTLLVYDRSHLMYDSYVKERGLTGDKNFLMLDRDYLEPLEKTALDVKKGSLVVWDSRLFHQNQAPSSSEERLVQYVSYMPRNHKDNTKTNEDKRLHAFKNGITTTHWAAPMKRHSWASDEQSIIFDMKNYGNSIYNLI